jgi:nicotinamide mononucleotide transporter
MMISNWFTNNYIEVFGAVTGILYVFLEIRQTIWLWPVGIITSAVYIWVFFSGKLYADMSLQGYYLFISLLGWYWWARGSGLPAESSAKAGRREDERMGERENGGRGDGERGRIGEGETGRGGDREREELHVTRLKLRTGIILSVVFVLLYTALWYVLDKMTDSPVPEWDSFITSLSIIATWMLARKIYEHWFLWIVVNTAATLLFLTRGLYPTVILYIVYGTMSFAGLKAWKKTISITLPV